jgi:hypothetical protein
MRHIRGIRRLGQQRVEHPSSRVVDLAGAWLAVMVASTLAVIGVLTAIPTRLGARRPVADVLK